MLVFDNMFSSDIVLPKNTLLLNIETTGLSPRTAFIYMIGMAWHEDDGWHFRCLLAESRMDERRLMESFYEQLSSFSCIVTYGGHSFSHRFMENRWANYSDDNIGLFDNLSEKDIQKELTSYRHYLALPDLKKTTIESFLDYKRCEMLSGRELIKIYTQWERLHDEDTKQKLLAHHFDDMRGLVEFTHLFAYIAFWNGEFDKVYAWQIDKFDANCDFKLMLKYPVPNPIHYRTEFSHTSLNGSEAILTIPVYKGRLKYFLPGPVKDYYYLPAEDRAIHRSVAQYVDKAHRQKATAATCYTTADGLFLPTTDNTINPHFLEDYQSKIFYIKYAPEEWQNTPEIPERYVRSCI